MDCGERGVLQNMLSHLWTSFELSTPDMASVHLEEEGHCNSIRCLAPGPDADVQLEHEAQYQILEPRYSRRPN